MITQAVFPKVYPFKMESILNMKTEKVEAADYWLCQGKAIVKKLEISLSEKRKQYACPCCKTPVILKHGKRRLPYFAHPVLEDAQSCKITAVKVKSNKKSVAPTTVKEPARSSQLAVDQPDSHNAKIITFYPDYNNWDSTLGATNINYFVTPNQLSGHSNEDAVNLYHEFDDSSEVDQPLAPSTVNWEAISFEFVDDHSTIAEEQTSNTEWDEDLNIEWLLNQYGGQLPKNYTDISDQDLVRLIFEQKLSRSLNNLRTRILDLKITGFNLPENILDIMSDKGLIKRLEQMSQIQFERAS